MPETADTLVAEHPSRRPLRLTQKRPVGDGTICWVPVVAHCYRCKTPHQLEVALPNPPAPRPGEYFKDARDCLACGGRVLFQHQHLLNGIRDYTPPPLPRREYRGRLPAMSTWRDD